MGPRIYLKLGDRVEHREFSRWGSGCVVEEKHSTLEGGSCLVRIKFADGKERTFNNDLDHQQCCYYFGVRLI